MKIRLVMEFVSKSDSNGRDSALEYRSGISRYFTTLDVGS